MLIRQAQLKRCGDPSLQCAKIHTEKNDCKGLRINDESKINVTKFSLRQNVVSNEFCMNSIYEELRMYTFQRNYYFQERTSWDYFQNKRNRNFYDNTYYDYKI